MPQYNRDPTSGKGPFVRRTDLQRSRRQSVNPFDNPHDQFAIAWVKNESGQSLSWASVIQFTDSLVDPTQGDKHQSLYQSQFVYRGDLPDGDGVSNVGILLASCDDDRGAPCLVIGQAIARLTGDIDASHADTRAGEHALEASSSGPFQVLHDPGPAGEERLARVRFAGGTTGGGLWLMRIDEFVDNCNCRVALCTILRKPCGNSGWAIGEQVHVIDFTPEQCVFNDVIEELEGVTIIATRTESDEYLGEAVIEDPYCTLDGYELIDEFACHFTAVGRCCS